MITGRPQIAPDEDSRVYVICGGTAYEALLHSDGGFTVYVPESAEPEGVVYAAGGEYKLFSADK